MFKRRFRDKVCKARLPVIQNASQHRLRRGDLGLGRPDPCLERAIEGAEGRVTARQRSGGLQKCLAGAGGIREIDGGDTLAAKEGDGRKNQCQQPRSQSAYGHLPFFSLAEVDPCRSLTRCGGFLRRRSDQ